jgi:glutamyl-tRNA reductase
LNGITEDQRKAVDVLSSAIVNKIMHAPIVVLKQAASGRDSNDLLAFGRKLFNLDKELKRAHLHEKGLGPKPKEEKK